MVFGMRNLILPGSRSKSHRKRKSRRNYLVQVSTCWFLLQFVNLLQESLVQSLYWCSPRLRPIGNRQRSSSRRHDWISQITCSNLPLNHSRSNLFSVVEERENRSSISEKVRSKRTHSCRTHRTSLCWLCALGASWRNPRCVMTHSVRCWQFALGASWRTKVRHDGPYKPYCANLH